MTIKGSIALVTGSNRGLGAAFARGLAAAGAARVYAAARDPAAVKLPGVAPHTPERFSTSPGRWMTGTRA